MARTQTLVQLNDVLLAALDQRAARRNVSRSQIIREAVEAYVADDYDGEITRRILAGYERFPPQTVDDWGNVVAGSHAATTAAHQRLDDEERSSGDAPW